MRARFDGKINDTDWNLSLFASKIDSSMVTVVVPREFALTLDFAGLMFGRVIIPAGTTSLPTAIASHPWARQNGVH